MAKDHARIEIDALEVEQVMLHLTHDRDVERAFLRLFGSGGVVPRDIGEHASRMDTEQFKEHAFRYLQMYLPTSGFCILPDTRCAAKAPPPGARGPASQPRARAAVRPTRNPRTLAGGGSGGLRALPWPRARHAHAAAPCVAVVGRRG